MPSSPDREVHCSAEAKGIGLHVDTSSATKVHVDIPKPEPKLCDRAFCGVFNSNDERDDNSSSASMANVMPRMSCGSCGGIIPCCPPYLNNRNMTAKEAYNRGMLLSYFVSNAYNMSCNSCCLPGPITTEDLERRWCGHQPLVSYSLSTTSDGLSSYEDRKMRRRRRRGVVSLTMSPSARDTNINDFDDGMPHRSRMDKSPGKQGRKTFFPPNDPARS
jgi:hypothetical protein